MAAGWAGVGVGGLPSVPGAAVYAFEEWYFMPITAVCRVGLIYNDKNTITLQTSAGKVKYSINDETGILKSLGEGSEKLIAYKTSNQLFSMQQENQLFSFDIIKFTCEKINNIDVETYGIAIGDTEGAYTASFYQLILAFKLYFKNELIDTIEFKRKVFSPKAYINKSV